MDLRTATGEKVELHPALLKFAAEDLASVTAMSGYLGPSTRDGYVVLYRSLRHLDQSVELRAADILHIENVPETTAPFGAKTVWVRDDAEVARRSLGTGRADSPPGTSCFVESQVGRLHMRQRVRPAARSADCSQNCISGPCISPCNNCENCTSNCNKEPA